MSASSNSTLRIRLVLEHTCIIQAAQVEGFKASLVNQLRDTTAGGWRDHRPASKGEAASLNRKGAGRGNGSRHGSPAGMHCMSAPFLSDDLSGLHGGNRGLVVAQRAHYFAAVLAKLRRVKSDAGPLPA